MLIRSFIALSVPRSMANSLGDAVAKMAYQDKSNAVRWVDQGNFHVTLSFLGEQRESALARLAETMEESIVPSLINLKVTHFSPFPEGRPKLIAAMIEQSEGLRSLHHQVSAALIRNGIRIEKRRFIPHITLGRIRHSRNQFMGQIPSGIAISAEALEVVLYESKLFQNGAQYEPMYSVPLDFNVQDYDLDFEDVIR